MKNPFNEDDYFQGSTMSFGEHLEELRRVLINALWGLAVCMLIGFAVAPAVVRFFKGPIERALGDYYREKAVIDLGVRYNGNPPLEMVNLIQNREMVPEYFQMELSELVDNLQFTFPGQFEALKFSPYTFVPDDFESYETTVLWMGTSSTRTPVPTAAKFAKRWETEGEAESDTAGKQLWELLTSDEQKQIAAIAEKKEEEVTIDDRRQVALALNRLVSEKSLADNKELLAIGEESGYADLIKTLNKEVQSEEAGKKDQRRLNKLLLSAYFSDSLRPPQLTLVDVPVWRPVKIRVQSLNAQEAFMIWMKAAFMTGLVLASPWIFYQLWSFVGAGLYPHEKGYVYQYLPVSLILFVAGAALAFMFVFENVLHFLFYFNRIMEIDPDPRIGEWLGFVLLMPLAFGLSFQLPLVMLFLNRIGVVDVKTYVDHWRVALLAIAVAAMIITPGGDPYSMLMMMAPLIGLYFLGIAMCKWMPRSRNPFFDEVREP